MNVQKLCFLSYLSTNQGLLYNKGREFIDDQNKIHIVITQRSFKHGNCGIQDIISTTQSNLFVTKEHEVAMERLEKPRSF